MNSARVAVAGITLIVILLGVMEIPLPPEVARQLAELGIPVPKSLLEKEPSDFATLGELPHTAGSFSSAKRSLYEDIYDKHRQTFYCGCDFDPRRSEK